MVLRKEGDGREVETTGVLPTFSYKPSTGSSENGRFRIQTNFAFLFHHAIVAIPLQVALVASESVVLL